MRNFYFKIGTIARRIKNQRLKPVAILIKGKLKMPSNLISIGGATAGIASALFIFQDHRLFTIFLLSALAMDIMDGAVARLESKKEKGWMMDGICDRIVTASLLVAFLYKHSFDPRYVALFLVYLAINAYVLQIRRLTKGRRIVNLEAVAYILFIFKNFEAGVLVIVVSTAIGLINAVYLKKTFSEEERK